MAKTYDPDPEVYLYGKIDGLKEKNEKLRKALERIYQSRATHCQGCKEHGQIAKAALRRDNEEENNSE
jgi:hypothetical protein